MNAPRRNVVHDLNDSSLVKGICAEEFDLVRREFQRNFSQRDERGAACAVYYRGRKVVDLWGGTQSRTPVRPWNDQTLVLAFSVSKGMAAAAMVVAHSQGLFELDEPVARYWPEFSGEGKAEIIALKRLSKKLNLLHRRKKKKSF